MRVSLSKGFRRGVCVSVLLALFGCRTEAPYVVPETPMPPNTILLSQMMRELSATPGFTDALLAQLQEVNPAVDVINKVVTKHPGTPVGTPSGSPTEAPPSADKGVIAEYLDLGSYTPDASWGSVALQTPFNNLGTFNLSAGDYNVVGVSRWTSGTGYVIADAIRIRR